MRIKKQVKKYVVALISNSCDPTIYGPFDSEEKAEQFLTSMKSTWTERDWYNCNTETQVTELITKGQNHDIKDIRAKNRRQIR